MSADNFPYVEGQPAEIYFDGKWHRGKIIAVKIDLGTE